MKCAKCKKERGRIVVRKRNSQPDTLTCEICKKSFVHSPSDPPRICYQCSEDYRICAWCFQVML